MTGVMQGRLVPPTADRIQSFPKGRWADEFELAHRAGLDAIEWIDDIDDELSLDDNPIWTDAGIEKIHLLSARYGVAVRSICADSFMKVRLAADSADEQAAAAGRLYRLLNRARGLGASRIVLPFVDSSSIAPKTARALAAAAVAAAAPVAKAAGVELHLETDLPPLAFAAFLDDLPGDVVKVNYDSGNSASLGYDPVAEFAAYGDRVGSVHVKDRLLGGSTVPLGTGAANLPALFELLAVRQYSGPIILQAARGRTGDELATVTAQRETVEELYETARVRAFESADLSAAL